MIDLGGSFPADWHRLTRNSVTTKNDQADYLPFFFAFAAAFSSTVTLGCGSLPRCEDFLVQDPIMRFGAAFEQTIQIKRNISDRKICHRRDYDDE
jgi:hypothetical protein